MKDHAILYSLIEKFVDAVDIQEKYEIAKNRVAKAELLDLKTMLRCEKHKTGLYACVIEVNKLLRPYLEMLGQKKRRILFLPELLKVIDKLKRIDNEPRQLVVDSKYQGFPDIYVKAETISPRNYNETLAIQQMSLTIKTWIDTLEKVVSEFRTGGKYSAVNSQNSNLSYIPAVSCLAESIVASSSLSRRVAPRGTSKYHSSKVKLIRNEFPSFSFICGLNESQHKKVNQLARKWKQKYTEKNRDVKDI